VRHHILLATTVRVVRRPVENAGKPRGEDARAYGKKRQRGGHGNEIKSCSDSERRSCRFHDEFFTFRFSVKKRVFGGGGRSGPIAQNAIAPQSLESGRHTI